MLLDKSFVCWRGSVTRLALVQRCLTGLSRPPTRTLISARLADAFRCWKTSWLKTPFSSTRILRSLKLNGLALSFLAAPLIRQIECKRKVSGELSRRADELAKKTREEPEGDLTLEDIWSLLKPHFGWFIAAVVAAIATAVLNIQLPLLLGELIDAMAEIIKEKALLGAASLAHLRPIGTKIATIYIAQAVLTFLYIAFLTVLGERMAVEMRLRLFSRLLSQDAAFYDVNKTAELGARLNTDVQEFKSCFKLTVSQGLRTFAQTGGCVVSLYTISARMTLMTMAFLPVVIIAGTICGAFLRSMSRQAQAQSAIAASVSDEALGNIRTVKSFAMEEHEKRLFAREVEKAAEQQELLGAGIGLFQGGSNLFLNGIVLSVLYGGSSLIASGELSPGDLMSFLVTAQTIQRSLSQLSIVFGHAVKGWTAGARVFQFVNIPPGLEAGSGGRIPYHSLFGDIHFENVSFSYPSRPGHHVLENLDLKISGGQVVALCGPSGEGKSTLTALLERFYEPTLGRITIDGQDIRDLDVGWLRGSAIGLISQEPVLFMTSIEENIRYGKPSATDEEVRQAARLANAEEFIQRFPQGYKTIVGERGAQLSGGQKQRVAIARALLKNPPILILDEATSALDAESEKLVREALDTASRGRTVLVIAHRLSTIQNSDKIAVIRGRRVAEEGQHEDLMTKRGIYYNLVKSQYQT